MLKAKLSNGNVLFGLDRQNIERLTGGSPILIKKEDINLEFDIYIFFGESLDDILKELEIPGVQ